MTLSLVQTRIRTAWISPRHDFVPLQKRWMQLFFPVATVEALLCWRPCKWVILNSKKKKKNQVQPTNRARTLPANKTKLRCQQPPVRRVSRSVIGTSLSHDGNKLLFSIECLRARLSCAHCHLLAGSAASDVALLWTLTSSNFAGWKQQSCALTRAQAYDCKCKKGTNSAVCWPGKLSTDQTQKYQLFGRLKPLCG